MYAGDLHCNLQRSCKAKKYQLLNPRSSPAAGILCRTGLSPGLSGQLDRMDLNPGGSSPMGGCWDWESGFMTRARESFHPGKKAPLGSREEADSGTDADASHLAAWGKESPLANSQS